MGHRMRRYLVVLTQSSNQPLLVFFAASVIVLPFNLFYIWYTCKFSTEGLSLAAIYYGRDFVNYWSGGRLAASSQVMTLYDIGVYQSWVSSHFTPDMARAVFSYPPSMPLLLLPFGALPHAYALLLWSVLGITGYWFVCFYRTPAGRSWLSLAVIATASVVLFNLTFGQLGLFLALAFVGALRLLPTRPVLAGVIIGLLTVKPQLGPLLVIVLLMRREWTAVAAACVSALALAGASLLLWGPDPWLAYIHTTVPFQAKLLQDMNGFYARVMTTPYGGFYALGAPTAIAMIAQVIVAVMVVIASIFVLRRKTVAWPLQVVIIAFGASLLTPYMLAYDLAIPLAALLWYISDQNPTMENRELWAFAALWSLCFSVGITVQALGLPILPLLMLACFLLLLLRAHRNAVT
jgi:Glycosyltransferase family 87